MILLPKRLSNVTVYAKFLEILRECLELNTKVDIRRKYCKMHLYGTVLKSKGFSTSGHLPGYLHFPGYYQRNQDIQYHFWHPLFIGGLGWIATIHQQKLQFPLSLLFWKPTQAFLNPTLNHFWDNMLSKSRQLSSTVLSFSSF